MEEAQEEVLMNSNNNNKTDQQSHIVKGKRTKRQRPDQSPIPSNMSPAASSEEDFFDSTEEDEDMANCLILLAQCQSRESPTKRAHYDQQHEINGVQMQIQQQHNSKFTSRRFLEPPSSGTGKGGYYVYECKTCNRTFPSFQALGGHRASHKKPKAMNMMNHEIRSLKSQQQHHQHQHQQQFLVSNSDEEDGNFRNVSSLSLQLSNNNRGGIGNSNLYSSSSSNKMMKSNKIHECSICGAEFTSGQALGGHMRRHRSAPVAAATTTTTTNTTLSLTPMAVEVEEPRKSRNNILSLDLDLNLPAPEDDIKESKLPFSSKQQQQQQKSSLVISAGPTLVDCHY